MIIETLSEQEFNNALNEANRLDFNDMRAMLTEIEQGLLGTNPEFQANFYTGIQQTLYEMLEQVQTGTITKPVEKLVNEICLN